MEDNEEEDFDDYFPGNAGIGAFDDDIPMEEPEVDVAENDPSDDPSPRRDYPKVELDLLSPLNTFSIPLNPRTSRYVGKLLPLYSSPMFFNF